jgi:Glycoside-hydrolase family GH114
MRRLAGGIGVLAVAAVVGATVAALATAGESEPSATGPESGADTESAADMEPTTDGTVAPPTPNLHWDYQIGGAFPPAAEVRVVSRDRNARPAPRGYNVCYVNAYQTQPDERSFWIDNPRRWRLVLKDRSGDPVVDGAWGEFLLDIRTAAKRSALVGIVGRWVDGCAADGFDAVEYDNLDSWSRSRGLLTKADNVAFARLLTARAHAAGLAAAQKNWAELSPRGPRLGFDFAVAEECGRWRECRSYAAAYDDHVLVVEYRRTDFVRACRGWRDRLSIVLRDRDVTPSGVNRRC